MQDKNSNQIQAEISNAFQLLSAARVSGELVEIVAAVKMSLRRAYQMAADKPETEQQGEKK